LVEAEKGGAWYDRTADTVGRMFGKKDAKWIGGTDVQNAVICIAFGLAGLSGFCLQSLSVLPPGVLVVGALILTMFSIFIYHQERSSAAAKLLKNYPLEDHSLDLAKLEVSQVPVSVPTPQSVLQ